MEEQESTPRLLLWSAPDERRESRRRRALCRYLTADGPADPLPRAARLAARTRGTGTHRGAVVATTADEAAAALTASAAPAAPGAGERRGVVLLFPGQGAQQQAMAAGLYGHEPHFTAALDEVFAALGPDGARLRDEWRTGSLDQDVLDDATCAQPLLFGVGYALGRMVTGWGVTPSALLGHSVGELVAATLAGVFTLPDAVRVLRDRVAEAVSTPPGGMLAVAAPADELAPYLPDGARVAVAAVNAPRQTLLAGPDPQLREVEEKLRAGDVTCRRAAARQAFHSPVMDEAARRSLPLVTAVAPRAPRIPLHSAYTGGLLDAERATQPEFWARQMADPVLFWPTLGALLDGGRYLVVEAGPGQGLSALARQHAAVRSGRSTVVPLLPARPAPGRAPGADRRAVLEAARRLWIEGHPLDAAEALTGAP